MPRRGTFPLAGCVALGLAIPQCALAQTPEQRPGGTIIIATSPPPVADRGPALMAEADAALARRDWAAADAAFRRAWDALDTRSRAAEALGRLHRSPGFRLLPETSRVDATAALVGPTFARSETPHFVILSDCDAGAVSSLGRTMERTRDQFYRVMRRMEVPVVPHERKLLCVLFSGSEAYRAFARTQDQMDAAWAAGYYSSATNRIVFFNDASAEGCREAVEAVRPWEARADEISRQAGAARQRGQIDVAEALAAQAEDLRTRARETLARIKSDAASRATAKTIHEAVHLLAFNSGLQSARHDYPFWLSEGLAASFESDQPGRAFGPDRPMAGHPRAEVFAAIKAESKLLPLSTLISLGRIKEEDDRAVDGLYAQSYALFMYLFQKNPRGLGRYFLALAEEPQGRIPSQRHAAIFTACFGDPDSIEQRILSESR